MRKWLISVILSLLVFVGCIEQEQLSRAKEKGQGKKHPKVGHRDESM